MPGVVIQDGNQFDADTHQYIGPVAQPQQPSTSPTAIPQQTEDTLKPAQTSLGGELASMSGRNWGGLGAVLHGMGEPVAGALEAYTKLSPTGGVPDVDPNTGMPIDYGQGPGNVPQSYIDSARNMIRNYETEYNLNRNKGSDLQDMLGQGVPFALTGPSGAAEGAFDVAGAKSLFQKELLKYMGYGAGVGATSPTNADTVHESTGDFLEDKLKQAGIGAAIGAGGKLAGDMISPNVNTQTQTLLDRNVQPTMGQLARQSGNPLVSVGGWTEALSSGLPIVGSDIRDAQARAVLDLNKTIGNTSLNIAGLPPLSKDAINGNAINAELKNKYDDAYDTLLPKLKFSTNNPNTQVPITNAQGQVIGSVDPLDIKLQVLSQLAPTMGKDREQQYQSILQNYVTSKISPSGQMSGDTLKSVLSGVRKKYTDFKSSDDPNDRMLGDHLENLYDAIKQNAIENSNPEDVAALANLDAGYHVYAGLSRPAGSKALSSNGTATPYQFAQAMKNDDSSVGKGRTARGTALQQPLVNAANNVLTKLPDSETANRAAQGRLLYNLVGAGALGGAGEAAGASVPEIAAGLIAGKLASWGAYSPWGQNVGQWLLTGRQGPVPKYFGAMARSRIPALAGSQTSGDTPSTTDQMNALMNTNGGQ